MCIRIHIYIYIYIYISAASISSKKAKGSSQTSSDSTLARPACGAVGDVWISTFGGAAHTRQAAVRESGIEARVGRDTILYCTILDYILYSILYNL